jgi:hypothetical protein
MALRYVYRGPGTGPMRLEGPNDELLRAHAYMTQRINTLSGSTRPRWLPETFGGFPRSEIQHLISHRRYYEAEMRRRGIR